MHDLGRPHGAQALRPSFLRRRLTLLVQLRFNCLTLSFNNCGRRVDSLANDRLARTLSMYITQRNAYLIRVARVGRQFNDRRRRLVDSFLLITNVRDRNADQRTLLRDLLVFRGRVVGLLHLLITSNLDLFLRLLSAQLRDLRVLRLRLNVSGLLVTSEISQAISVRCIVIVRATRRVGGYVNLAGVYRRFIAWALTFQDTLRRANGVSGLGDYERRLNEVSRLDRFISALVERYCRTRVELSDAGEGIYQLHLNIQRAIRGDKFARIERSRSSALRQRLSSCFCVDCFSRYGSAAGCQSDGACFSIHGVSVLCPGPVHAG